MNHPIVTKVPKEERERLEAEAASLNLTLSELVRQKLKGDLNPPKRPDIQGRPWPNSEDFDLNEKGEPLCIHDNKVIILQEDEMHLGNETAICNYKRKKASFDPWSEEGAKWCRSICKTTRLNLNVERIAVERAKLDMRAQAQFNLQAEKAKLASMQRRRSLPSGPQSNPYDMSGVNFPNEGLGRSAWGHRGESNYWGR